MVVEGAGVVNEAGYWVKGAGGHERGYQLTEELKNAGATTLPAILRYAVTKHGDAPCLGTRQLLARERVTENNKKLEKLQLGEYTFLSYREVLDQVNKFSVGLQSLGTGDTGLVATFAETRAEWFMSAIGCLQLGLSLVTIYTNLADENVVSSLNETEVSVVITTYDLLQRILSIIPKCPKVKKLIVMEDQLEGIGSLPENFNEVSVIGFKDVVASGGDGEPTTDLPVGSDLAIIMYTSGSSGQPKGVELTHDNIFYAISGYTIQADLQLGDRYLAYLPLAHVMELGTEIALVAMNVTIAYSSPLTLTNSSPKIMKGTLGDSRIAKPTCITCVPLILDRIIKGVSKTIEDQSFLKAKVFQGALKLKMNMNKNSLSSLIMDSLIFNKVKEELGGELRMMVVGGAPLSQDTQKKIRAMFGCTLQVGYGATETAASICSSDTDDPRPGHCGPPNYGVLLKLCDWEEGGYCSTDKPNPRGEILVGGPTVSRGYFRLPEQTKDAFIEEDGVRWFQTGDIGEIDSTGVVRIIDRKKDLIKLRHGEYICLGAIEAKLKTLPLVESICVWARPGARYCIAIIVPVMDRLVKLAVKQGHMEDDTSHSICQDPEVVSAVLKEIEKHGKKQNLTSWDIPKGVYLSPETWTPESGLVTAALKNRRNHIVSHFSEQINALYAELEPED